jgi:glycosyltransferase involved in cell wall biosynthesis
MDRYITRKPKRAGDRAVSLCKVIDSFALLTKPLAEALEIGDKPFVITECICNEEQRPCTENKASKNRCLYTGTLAKESSVCELADAFVELEHAELWVCGNGDGAAYIENLAKMHENIKFFGFLSADKLQELREGCDFLINPRRPTGTYTKYSFPSKTAEYMMSGKPVIMYKLEGVPDEYDQFLNYLAATEPHEMKNELSNLFSKEYGSMVDKANAGREYMLRNKNSKSQAEKIPSLLNKA